MNNGQLKAQQVLPRFYDEAGLSDYVTIHTPRFVSFMHKNDWIGRQVLELGCGTGAAAEIFGEMRMAVTAVDGNPYMIEVAKARVQQLGYDVQLVAALLQDYTPVENTFDLIYSIDTLNYITSIRSLEQVFQQASRALQVGKQLFFDIRTIKDLINAANTVEVVHDSDDLYVTVRNLFDYDSLTMRRHFTVFYRKDQGFLRGDEIHVLRGYPYRAIEGMLQRAGFEIQHVLNLELEPFDPETDLYGRMVIMAQKLPDS